MRLDQLALRLARQARLAQSRLTHDAATRPQAHKLVLAIHHALRERTRIRKVVNVAPLGLLDRIRMERDLPHIRLDALDVPRHLMFRRGGRLLRAPDHVLEERLLVVQLTQSIDHHRRLQWLPRQAAQRPARVPRLLIIYGRPDARILRSHKVVTPRYRATIVSLSSVDSTHHARTPSAAADADAAASDPSWSESRGMSRSGAAPRLGGGSRSATTMFFLVRWQRTYA